MTARCTSDSYWVMTQFKKKDPGTQTPDLVKFLTDHSTNVTPETMTNCSHLDCFSWFCTLQSNLLWESQLSCTLFTWLTWFHKIGSTDQGKNNKEGKECIQAASLHTGFTHPLCRETHLSGNKAILVITSWRLFLLYILVPCTLFELSPPWQTPSELICKRPEIPTHQVSCCVIELRWKCCPFAKRTSNKTATFLMDLV